MPDAATLNYFSRICPCLVLWLCSREENGGHRAEVARGIKERGEIVRAMKERREEIARSLEGGEEEREGRSRGEKKWEAESVKRK